MKLLMIGIDGGTKEILDCMPMPFVHHLFEMSASLEVDEDLYSRGWAEILTGKHGSDTNGFYLMPFCDGTYRFSKSYGMTDMLSPPEVKPLWQLLNERGYSVGFLNVPTTGPAPELDGFMVSGGGGGMKPGAAISPNMVWPREDVKLLNKHNYVFDIRLKGADSSFSNFVSKINAAHEAQKTAYIELHEKHNPDFGFYCFRITTELQYMAMYEIHTYIEEVKSARQEGRAPVVRTRAQEDLISHYVHMDRCIKELFDCCKPEHFLFVGDHSTACFRREANLDLVLAEAGYFKPKSTLGEKVEHFSAKLARRANAIAANYGLAKRLRPYRTPPFCFQRAKTLAFSTFFETGNFAGIYINDRARFSGPVATAADHARLVTEICDMINADDGCQSLGFSAAPYRSNFASARFQQQLPDIRIAKPDDILVTSRKSQFIVNNPGFSPLPENVSGLKYPHSGIKGRNPIFVASSSLRPLYPKGHADLTAVYRVVDNLFGAA